MKRKINTSGEEKENKQPRREFKCSICLKVFAQKNSCIRHQLSHDTFVACSFCGEKFRRKDYLKKHIKRKHQQRGEGSPHDEQLPISTVNQTENQRFLNDHDYVRSAHTAQHDQSSDHNYAISSKKDDHDYALPSSSSSLQPPRLAPPEALDPSSSPQTPRAASLQTSSPSLPQTPRPTSPTHQHEYAINNKIQDFTIQPSSHEQYDILVFFANIKDKIKQILISRLKKHAIKWYLSVQEELVKDGDHDQQTTRPHFRSRTNTVLNLETIDIEDVNEALQKMFESF